jgi:hypothetical protein
MNINEDIENQFCIVDESEDFIKKNQFEFELVNLHMFKKNLFYNGMNKLKKSKSYPDESISCLVKNDFEYYRRNNSIVNKQHNNNNIIVNINDLVISNSDFSNNLIENKSTIKIFTDSIKKIYNCCKYFIFCNTCTINKIEVLNKFLTICLHIFMMAIFEIYFYFNYVVWIEKNEFLKQINKYFGQLAIIPIDPTQKQAIKYIINSDNSKYNAYLDDLYKQYINSLTLQKKLLDKLLIKACMMAGTIGIVFMILFIIGLFYRKKIKWNWIWIENLLMFLFLGIFEYFFFMTIIMNYNPITNAELKYYVADGIIKYFNSTK